MKDLEMKQNVLKEIMDLMDARQGDKLKSHPKLVAAKIEVAKPKEVMMKADDAEESLESPEMEAKEGDSEVSPEMLQKLLEHFKGL